MLIVDEQLADRMVQIEIDNLISRIEGYPGVHIQSFGSATAFVSPQVAERFFNSVQGTSDATLAHLDAIEALYEVHGLTPTFEVVPSRMSETLGCALFERGYAMVQFHAGLVCRPFEADDIEGVAVEEVRLDQAFVDLYVASWQEPASEVVKQGMAHWKNHAHWRYFVASMRGEPAGAAVLDTRGTTALLGSAATLPSARGRGVQQALIAGRMREAARTGCEVLVGGAYFGTSSMRNQLRAGLSVAFTRGIWTKGQSQSPFRSE